MCGITGYLSYKNNIDTKIYYEAHRKIAHRGPDDEGFIYKNNNQMIEHLVGDDSISEVKDKELIYNKKPSSLILGHRRLSIIDLSAHGHQPLFYKDLSLVYNGEIYNYIELREELKDLNYSFNTDSDTEVVLKAYHCWGVKAFSKFNGMWAASIYDQSRQTLLITRDRFGIKPLYYCYKDETLIFGSEIKFIASFFNTLESNEKIIYDYLRFSYSDHTSESFFKDIFQLEPSSYIVCSKDGIKFKKYWDIEEEKDIGQSEIEDTLVKSIKLRLRSDVKVGSLLSGGIDSSTILGFIDRYKLSDKFDTFSAVFDEEEFSEKSYIDLFKTENIELKKHFIYPNSKELLKDLDNLLYVQEEPFRSLAVYSQYKIYQYIKNRSNITVLLNGQGADEIFTGYSEHYYYYLLSLIYQMKIGVFITEFKALEKNRNLSKCYIIKEMFRIFVSFFYQRKDKYKIFNSIPKQKSISKKFKNILKQKLFSDLTFSALREYLRYEDKNSMAFSLESRLPFLDFRLVNCAFSLKDSDKINSGISKFVLREVAKGKIPDKTLNRKDKMGFISPQEIWQRTILKDDFDQVFDDIGKNGLFNFLDHDRIYEVYKSYQTYSHHDWGLIWRIYILYRWKREWNIDG